MTEHSNGTATESEVVLVAHNGMSHDHVICMHPPKWRRVSDSYFSKAVGLNTYKVRDPLPFPTAARY
ncbi:hypothetical protein Tdes44962_MAKER02770 [Teratosphaeria destructans]|uniref:Uncharacterized protein n=1 Tax=Teratosphaeria destructans TaxID=418781 RepID=A0A9W7SS92_9PEZI|nr:hypothetical protein Tdes44962_MAKER02770 [Teratosphaeria destructans]